MIKCVKRADLDVKKWDHCVESSPNARIYGMSYYLDAVCASGTWAALVDEDYTAVMPLPINQRIPFFPRIMLPHLAQQLGVFTSTAPSPALIARFISAIPTTYKSVYVQLNSENPTDEIQGAEVGHRNNYVLPLQRDHDVLFKNYSRNLRRNVRLATKENMSLTTLSAAEFIPFFLAYDKSKYAQKNKILDILADLLPALIDRDKAIIYAAQDEKQNIIAACVITIFNKRLTNLMAHSSPDGKKQRAMHWLLDQVIQQHCTTMEYLDFEGSDIPSIAEFFAFFGGDLVPYSLVKFDRFPFSLVS